MKADLVENTNNEYLKKLDREIKNKIIQREEELNKLNDVYNKRNKIQTYLGEEAYLNKVNQVNQKILEANQIYEEKLNNYRDNLVNTKNTLTQEEQMYRDAHDQKINNLKVQSEDLYNSTYNNAINEQKDIEYKTQYSIRNIDEQSKRDKIRLEEKFSNDLKALGFEYDQKNSLNEKTFNAKLKEDLKTHHELLLQNKEEFKKNLTLTAEKNKRLEEEKVRIQSNELQFLENYHKNLMEQKVNDFKTRFETLSKEHEQILSDLKLKLDTEMKKATADVAKVKQDIIDKSKDEFYHLEMLEPKIEENEKFMTISLKVPEHEKENVHLVAHGRNLKLTLSKRYSDILEDKDGSINRSSKTQLYSKELTSKDILNPKNQKQKYENGVLTFLVAKL